MLRLKVFGSANIGLYFKSTNKFFIYHANIIQKKINLVHEELKVTPVPVYLVDTLITSPFIVANKNGVIVTSLFEPYALDDLANKLKELDVNFAVVDVKYTALGNIIVANDRGAISSPILPKSIRKIVSDVLDVEVVSSTIGRFSYVGSLAAVNNKFGISSPSIKEDEKQLIEDVLKIKLYESTVNNGVELVSLGIVLNDNGIVVGEDSSGKELMLLSAVFESL